MELNDYLNMTDSKIRGVVVLKREDGTIVFTKENMIVRNGRKFIRDTFIKNGLGSIGSNDTFGEYVSEFNDYSLSHIAFGNNDAITTFNMTELVGEGTGLRIKIDKDNTTYDEQNIYIKFRAVIDRTSSENGYTARELGLIMTSTDDLPGKLFSRIVFDPVTVGASEKYEIEYYIYF